MCSLFLWSSVRLTLKLLNEKTTLGMNKGPQIHSEWPGSACVGLVRMF